MSEAAVVSASEGSSQLGRRCDSTLFSRYFINEKVSDFPLLCCSLLSLNAAAEETAAVPTTTVTESTIKSPTKANATATTQFSAAPKTQKQPPTANSSGTTATISWKNPTPAPLLVPAPWSTVGVLGVLSLPVRLALFRPLPATTCTSFAVTPTGPTATFTATCPPERVPQAPGPAPLPPKAKPTPQRATATR